MAILTGTLHCPRCGTTDPLDWWHSLGSPEIGCTDCGEYIVEECDPDCEHLTDDEIRPLLSNDRPQPSAAYPEYAAHLYGPW